MAFTRESGPTWLETEIPSRISIFPDSAIEGTSASALHTRGLAEIKNPRPVAFVKQANIAHGPQQVNNANGRGPPAPARAEKLATEVSQKSKLLAMENDNAAKIVFRCTFRQDERWSYRQQELMVGALMFQFQTKKDWVAQTVRADASLGYYDHLRQTIVLPDKHGYALGQFDNRAWKETKQQWDDDALEPNSFRMSVTLTRSPLRNAPGPSLDELISVQEVELH